MLLPLESPYLAHNKTSTWDDKLKTIATRILATIPDMRCSGVRLSCSKPGHSTRLLRRSCSIWRLRRCAQASRTKV